MLSKQEREKLAQDIAPSSIDGAVPMVNSFVVNDLLQTIDEIERRLHLATRLTHLYPHHISDLRAAVEDLLKDLREGSE